ncbi:MAG: glycosyltransferase family 4 protein [Chloroflexi bacterium]|nr:glycosyltransferase family 4 protein [Chloroflexota bacterium]
MPEGVEQKLVFAGNFGLRHKQTIAARALPLARALAAYGHETVVVVPPWDSPADAGQRVDLGGVVVQHTVAAPPAPVPRLLAHLWLAGCVAAACWRERPDLVYAFKPKAHAGATLLVFWLLRLLRLYRGLLWLDTDDWEGEGGWNKRERARFSAFERRVIAWHERWCLRHADIVTVASRGLGQLAAQAGARRVVYLPNAASDQSPGWHPGDGTRIRRELGLGNRPLALVYTRFVEFRVARLVETLAAIRTRCPRVAFVVVGVGLAGEEHAFDRLAGERGLGDSIVRVGWAPRDQLPDYFAAADVALYPLDDTLLNRTKCPVKLLDLLLAGVPVVADAVGQASEYIADGTTGMLVPPGDVEAMAAAAVRLLEDPALRLGVGQAARTASRRQWNWARWVEVVAAGLRQAGG